MVDVNGNKVEDIYLLNGDGQYFEDGSSRPDIKRIGNSDIFLTRDGLLTDEFGKPMMYKGKPVKVGTGGRLMTIDGEFIADAKGNGVFITNDGELKNREGLSSKGVALQDSDGVSIDSLGKRVNNGGKLTDLGGGVYKTADGLLVDRAGKPIEIEGKQVFIDGEGGIVDANGRSVRYEGKSIYLSKTGSLLDSQGSSLTSEGQSLSLTSKGIVKEDGTLTYFPQPSVVESLVPNPEIKEQFSKIEAKPVESEIDEVKIVNGGSDQVGSELPELFNVIDVSALTEKEILRLNARYMSIYQSLDMKLSEYEGDFRKSPKSSTATFSAKEPETEVLSATKGPELNMPDGVISASDSKLLLKQKAGTVLYAANKMSVNTDLETKVVFDIMGLPHTHPLYRSTAHGVVTLRYDNIVIQFNSICPESGECYPVQAIAVDPSTKSASVHGEIDKHYWYRFGGLALATLTQGAAVAVGESSDRTEEYDSQGKVVKYSGLDGKELLIRSTEPLGAALASVFMENVNRPYTGIVANGEEVGIFLLEDVVLRENSKK